MTKQGLAQGLEILRKYMKPNDGLKTEGLNNYVNVVYDELEPADELQLSLLGWCAIDDRVGFTEKNKFRKHFFEWLNKQEIERNYDVDLTDEVRAMVADLTFKAMVDGVCIGCYDSELTKASMEYEMT